MAARLTTRPARRPTKSLHKAAAPYRAAQANLAVSPSRLWHIHRRRSMADLAQPAGDATQMAVRELSAHHRKRLGASEVVTLGLRESRDRASGGGHVVR